MKKVKMLMDFQGSETKGVFYLKDSEPELEDFIADRLVKDGRAVLVFDPELTQRIPHADPVNEPQFEEAEPEAPVEVPELPKKRGRR